MPQSLASLHVHFIFSTKNREPWLTAEFRPRLFEYVGGMCRQHDCVLVASGGTEDHVHLLASLGRTISAADFMRTVKAGSSGWIREADPNLRDFHSVVPSSGNWDR
jgi:REP element-mobilizing transposase RayT